MNKEKITFLIPSYNEEKNIALIAAAIAKEFKSITYKIIFINDGSTDSSLEEIKKLLKKKKQKIKLIDFSRNFGKEAAILAGLRFAENTEYTCIIDCDLQQPPSVAKKMLQIIEADKNVDSVVAYQETRKDTKLKNFFSSLFYKLINRVSNVKLYPSASDFRLFNNKVKSAVLEFSEFNRFSKGIFAYVGFENYYHPYVPLQREHGKTKWSFIALVKYSFLGITSFSSFPLLMPIYLFIAYLLLIISFFVISSFVAFNSSNLLFWLSLILGSILILLTLAIIGIYIDKIFKEVQKRPIFFIKSIEDNFNE